MKTFATAARPEPSAFQPCALCGAGRFSPLWKLEGFAFVRCPVCGLIQQNPQPLAASVLARYGAEYLEYEVARQYDYRDLELRALADLDLEARLAPLVAKARREGGSPFILDVGCATGALLAHFRDAGWAARGVEPCAEEAAWARGQYGLDVRTSTLEEADFPASSFDLVHASHLIEHLNDPRAFLGRARSLLKPDGYLVITTPNAAGFQAKLLGGRWRSAINDHLYLFSLSTLSRILMTSGFRIEKSVTWGGWALGLRPAFIKGSLDRAAKALGWGDVMAIVARPGRAASAG